MKTLLLILTLATTLSCSAQTTPPAPVQAAFAKNFPGITAKKWDKEDGNYEANFSKDGKTMSVTFDISGAWLETETDIAVKDLPGSVTAYIKEHYKGAGIKEAGMLKTPKGEMYEAEVKGKDLLFDMNGKFLKETED
ncbi:MAG: PepSY-like domain-containing protein [Panacibacter sp.]